MSKYTSILTALRAATGPSRELDEAVATALGYPITAGQRNYTMDWFPVIHWHGTHEPCPEWTGSIDSALTLVGEKLPGFDWHLSTSDDKSFCFWLRCVMQGFDMDVIEYAPTAPLAILVALFSALEAEER